ncbi:MAG: histidine kinase [Steroidobacteraceae bacterium]
MHTAQENQKQIEGIISNPPKSAELTAPVSSSLRRMEWLSIAIFWSFIAALTFINAMINDANTTAYRLPAAAPLIAAIVDSLIWGAITPVVFYLTSRYHLDHPKWPVSLIVLIISGIFLSMLVARFMAYVRFEQAVYYSQVAINQGEKLGVFDPLPIRNRFWFMNEFIIYLLVLTAGFAHDYFARYRARQEQARLLQTQAMQLRAELAEARLGLLRSQLDPHFLFNTLNTVSSLMEKDARGARRMIAQLSALLRDSLEDKDLEVPLERELSFLRRYIDIMQTRFHGRLSVVENIEPETLSAMVPTLVLQPLVENAIKHGIANLDGIGRIEIRAQHIDGQLLLSVIDNGTAAEKWLHAEQTGTGLGLSNTRARLSQSYGANQSLDVHSNVEGGVMVRVMLPFHTSPPALSVAS